MLELIDLSLLGRCGAGEQSEQSEQSAPLTAGVETAQSTLRSSASNNHQSTAGALAGQTWEKQLTMWQLRHNNGNNVEVDCSNQAGDF